MTENEFEPINRLSAWLRDSGYMHINSVVSGDIVAVLEMAKQCAKWREVTGMQSPDEWYDVAADTTSLGQLLSSAIAADSVQKNDCSCHERDSSYVCDYCRAQGEAGHMQRAAT